MLLIGFVALLAAAPAAPETLLDRGYYHLYNLEFPAAQRTFAEWGRQHPDDPMAPVSQAAAYLYSEFDRLNIFQSEFFTENNSFFRKQAELKPDPKLKGAFEAALTQGQTLAASALAKQPDDENAMFAALLASGLRSDYLAMIEKRNMGALTEAKNSRALAEKLLARHPQCYDAYLAVGVENYLLSLRAAPVRWVLQAMGAQTDRDTGIAKLRLTAEKGRYLMPYAKLLLGVAALRDKDKTTAIQILEWLAARYPGNRVYREELAKLRH